MSEKIVVIGSNSFSGADFVDLLLSDPDNAVMGISRSAEKDEVFLPYLRRSPRNFTFHPLDLNQNMPQILQLLDAFEPDYIVNFAAQSEVAPSWKWPGQWFQTNAVAIANLCNHLKNVTYLKRYVHISSPEVYGACAGTVKEDTPLNPSTPYAASKAAGDLFLWTLVKNAGFPLIMIRATNVYGAYQQLHKIIPRSVIYIKNEQTISLHGGGHAVKSYIHIRDVSEGELAAMRLGFPGSLYHLSPDQGIAVRDLVGKIAMRMGKTFDQVTQTVEERLGQDAAYIIDSSRARRELGWSPKISIDVGLHFGKVLTGSFGGFAQPAKDIPRLLALQSEHHLDYEPLISHRYALEEINRAITEIRRGEVIRTMVEIND